MKTLNGLPVYKMTIDENDIVTGVEYISLVDFPAIEVNWVSMNAKTLKLYAASEDKQMLYGPAMIPDLPIYRADDKLGEYYVSFDASEIEKIFKKFNKEQRTLGINYMHQENSQVKSAVITEQWTIHDKNNDYSNTLGFDLPVGTKMVGVFIEDKEFWEREVKSGNVRGFSIEGFLNLEMAKIKNKKIDTIMTKIKMNAEIKTVDGAVLFTPADGFTVDAEVYTVDADGYQTVPADGDIVLENGTTLVVVAGKITEVKEVPADMADTEPETEARIVALETAVADLIGRITALETANTEMANANEVLTAANTEMAAKFAKLPGTTSSVTTKNDNVFGTNTRMSFQDKVDAVIALKNIKK